MSYQQQLISPLQCHQLSDGTRIYDFGREAFAVLELEVQAHTPHSIALAVGERLLNGRLNPTPGINQIYQQQTLAVKPGLNRLSMTMTHPGYNGGTLAISPEVAPFRYAEVKAHPGDQITVAQRAFFGTFDDQAATFRSSSPELDRIWDLCKYTMKATTPFGIFIDGNRERQAYEGDTYINQLSYLVCTSDFEISRKTIQRLFQFPTWPTEWQFAMIHIVHDYVLYGGSLEDARAWYPQLQDKLLLPALKASGLHAVHDAPEVWECPGFGPDVTVRDIVDWPQGERNDYDMGTCNLVTNCWFNGTLQRMAQLATLLQNNDDAEHYLRLARQNRQAIRRYMLKNGIFVDNPASTHTSLHSCFYPILWNIAEESEKLMIFQKIKAKGMACSVFGAQFLLETCYLNRQADYALQLLTSHNLRSWNNMLDKGATITMETWDDSCDPTQDWNHPWGAAPANIIVRHLAGIRPQSPGFATFLIDPQPASLTHFELTTPTPHGPIQLTMPKPGHFQISVPHGTVGVFRNQRLLPGITAFTLSPSGKPHR